MSSSASGTHYTVTAATATTAPIIVADDQGTASPVAAQPVHVNPYEAAKNIRHLVRDISARIMNYLPPEPEKAVAQAQEGDLKYTLGLVRQYIEETQTYLGQVTIRQNNQRNLFSSIAQAIEERRASVGREQFGQLRREADYEQERLSRGIARLARAQNYTDAAKKILEQGAKPATPMPDEEKKRIQDLCAEVHKLAQSLPTIPNAPLAPAENVLRAMATLLKNGGFLESSSEYVKVLQANDPNIVDEASDGDEDHDEDEE